MSDPRDASNTSEPPAYILELMKVIQATQRRMEVLEEKLSQVPTDQNGSSRTVAPANGGEDASDTENQNLRLGGPTTSVIVADAVAGMPTPTHNTNGTHRTAETYVTKEELERLLQEKNRTSNFSEFDLKLPYPAKVAAKPYPKDYASPKFKLFDGKNGDAREHLMKFVETLGVAGLDNDLKLKEFSKSLTGKAYTWYVNLVPGSVESWNQMCKLFEEKFFSTQEKVSLADMGREYQRSREDLMDYIERFREKALDIHEVHEEKELVKVCIQGMFEEYRVHIENLKIATFASLVENARRTNNSVGKQKESRSFRKSSPAVHAVQVEDKDERPPKKPKRDFQGRNRQWNQNEGADAPPFPVSVERVRALLYEWVKDGHANLPYVSRLPTNQDKVNPRYCNFHHTVNHPFAECRNMRWLIHRKVQSGEVVLAPGAQTNVAPERRWHINAVIHSMSEEPQFPQDEDARVAALMTSSLANSLLKASNVRHFFDMLGFSEEARKEVAETMVEVAAKYHGEGGLVDSRLKRFASAHKNAIVFTEADMCTPNPNHNKPLYVESMVNGMDVRRTFIDNGSGVNLMPLTTFRALDLDERDLRNLMTLNSFDNTSSNTLGCIMVNFKLANIHEQTCFHVIKADVAYHVLLGRKCLDSHYLLPSTLH